jgi:(1->4)-alpha-D-glucan 1-alpha-D-glucosylmutase
VVTVAEFHDANAARLRDWPFELNATATHDTKRGEDARVRIAALSEIPDEWQRRVSEWMRLNARHRTRVAGAWAPDRNDEYLFYQALIGAWPADAIPLGVPHGFIDRISGYMDKAIREAKVHTSWIDEDPAYGPAVQRFVREVLTGRTAERFLRSFAELFARVVRAGVANSLAQLVIKATVPGVPDFYQGTELWDLSFVDPDNRRPVDFEHRRAMLDAMLPLIGRLEDGASIGDEVDALLRAWPDGRIKLFVTACLLRLRRRQRDLFLRGGYAVLEPDGPLADHVVAFERRAGDRAIVIVAPRLTTGLESDGLLPRGERAWKQTAVKLGLSASHYRHLLTGERVAAHGDRLALADVCRTLPIAVLSADA